MKRILIAALTFFAVNAQAQPDRWQQRIAYKMNVDMDVQTNRFTATQNVKYWNNSPDTLREVFFHLYLNAFQPGSQMDVRSRQFGEIILPNKRKDWDPRVKDRIANLKPGEIGYQKIRSLKMNGAEQQMTEYGTMLKVTLSKPILPKSTVVFDMVYDAQVPLQIRRTGRDNDTTTVRYSMAQWYPKLAEYDYEGWHAEQYIAREFYGVWGSYDVNISIDKNYKLGGTGILTNAAQIGWGYDKPGTQLKDISTAKRNWIFKADSVHDFVWAADPDYKHISRQVNGVTLHVIYKNPANRIPKDAEWEKVADAAQKELPFIEANFGKYPYKQYSFIHGGDGGMEYPMATLIVGPSLGTVFHEWMHTWYQMLMGTNESLYPWMDEGFTSWAETLVTTDYYGHGDLQTMQAAERKKPGTYKNITDLPEDHAGAYQAYYTLAASGLEEPMTSHSDHYNTNYAYSNAAYNKGEVFLEQLGYIIGAAKRDQLMKRYYSTWRFKHPNVNDFMVLAQKVSGMQLQWYRQYWVNTVKTIDYGIDSVWSENGTTKVLLRRIGLMPMPLDISVITKDKRDVIYNIPTDLTLGAKEKEFPVGYKVAKEWDWVNPVYVLTIDRNLNDIDAIVIDASKRMADVNRSNNIYTK